MAHKIDMEMKANDWGELYHPGCGCIAGNCYYSTCPNGWYEPKKYGEYVKFLEMKYNNKNNRQQTDKNKWEQLTLW